MAKFCVLYSVTTSYDTTIVAKTKEEARKKVVEVVGEPVEIEDIYEVTK